MIADRGVPFAILDERASESGKPFGIITVDCSNPHEYDDGVAVEPLPSASELYRVTVLAVDTSPLYRDDHITKQALEKTESVYRNERTALEAYEPMLPDWVIKRFHFEKRTQRAALAVSFIVGKNCPPYDPSVGFGHVEVLENFNYKKFGNACSSKPEFESFGRAAAYIVHYLHGEHGTPEEEYTAMIHAGGHEPFRRGASINQAFMVAANHLVARIMKQEDALAIYRVHDEHDPSHTEFMSPKVARYSLAPGPHQGLGLDVYARVTSPLRRIEDFVMHGLLRARHENRPPDKRDKRLATATVQRLNQRIVADMFRGQLRLRDEDLWTPADEATTLERSYKAALA